MSSASSSGNSARISSVVMPSATLATTVATGIRRSRMHRTPPIFCGSPVIRSGAMWPKATTASAGCTGLRDSVRAGRELDLYPYPVALAADDAGRKRAFLVVAHEHLVARLGGEDRVGRSGPMGDPCLDDQIAAYRIGVVPQVVGRPVVTHGGHRTGGHEPDQAGFSIGPRNAERTRPNCWGVGSGSTTVQCG